MKYSMWFSHEMYQKDGRFMKHPERLRAVRERVPLMVHLLICPPKSPAYVVLR